MKRINHDKLVQLATTDYQNSETWMSEIMNIIIKNCAGKGEFSYEDEDGEKYSVIISPISK